jgi:hypothetical protein
MYIIILPSYLDVNIILIFPTQKKAKGMYIGKSFAGCFETDPENERKDYGVTRFIN